MCNKCLVSLGYIMVTYYSASINNLNDCVNFRIKTVCLEAVSRRCSVKKVFLKISQNSQENTCARVSFLIKLHAIGGVLRRSATLLKKRLWHRCFPVNFPKFSRTPFFIKHLRWLLLYIFFSIFYIFLLYIFLLKEYKFFDFATVETSFNIICHQINNVSVSLTD